MKPRKVSKASKARYMRRRRNATLAAIALAVVLIIIILIIVVGISKKKNKDATVSPVPTDTPTSVLPTIAPTDDYSDEVVYGDDGTIVSATPTASATTENGKQMFVTGDSVNVRKTASTSGDVLTKLAKNSSVTAYETDGDFTKIKTPSGEIGYIATKFLGTEKSTATEAPTTTPDTSKSTTMYVKGSDVNVRDKASSSGTRVTRLSNGTKVTAYSTSNGWTYIQYASGKYGYISSSYLTSTSATTAPSATAAATATPEHASDLVSIVGQEDAAKIGTVKSEYLNVTKASQTPKKWEDYQGYKVVYRIEKTTGGYYYIGIGTDNSVKYGSALDDFS